MMRRTSHIIVIGIIACMSLLPAMVSAMTFSPTRLFVDMAPGEEKVFSFEVQNETARKANAHVDVRAFTKSDEAGKPAFTNEQIATSIEKFIILSATELAFEPEEQKTYRFTVRIPADAAPGSYYGAIHLSFEALDGGAGTIAVTGPLVFVTVAGATDARLAIASVEFPSGVLVMMPSELEVSLRNDGTLVEVPKGMVQIENIFGKAIRAYVINLGESALLPGEVRSFQLGAPGDDGLSGELTNFGIGPYTWSVKVQGMHAPQIVHDGGRFWVLPWRILSIAVVATVVIAIVLGFLFPRKRLASV